MCLLHGCLGRKPFRRFALNFNSLVLFPSVYFIFFSIKSFHIFSRPIIQAFLTGTVKILFGILLLEFSVVFEIFRTYAPRVRQEIYSLPSLKQNISGFFPESIFLPRNEIFRKISSLCYRSKLDFSIFRPGCSNIKTFFGSK